MGRIGLILAVVLIATGCQSRNVIHISKSATDTEKLAASELEKYLEKMTGESYRVARGKAAADAFVVCNAEHVSEFGDAKGTYLVGESDRGTLYAVYEYLDGQGCRFLAPKFNHYGGTAEVIPRIKKLAEPAVSRSSPKLKFRKLYVEEGHSHNIENLKQMVEWMPKVGFNTLVIPTDYQGSGRVKWDNWRKALTPELHKRGIIIEVGGHGYQNFINAEMEEGKLFERHSDWFGKNAAGKPQRAKGWVFCTSNDGARDYMIGNFLAYVKDRPEIAIFDFWPPDGAKWCECVDCRKLGSPSDRQAILVEQVKERVASVRPDLRLEVLAYHTSVYPPEKARLDTEVLLDFCPISQQFDHQINDPAAEKNADYVRGVTAWRKAFDGDISIYSYYRKYAWDSLPVSIPHYMQKDLQWYATLPVQGVSSYSEPGDWFTYELNHYVLAALAWDSNADVDAIVKKFCDARYGDDSELAQSVFAALERITRTYSSIPHTSLKNADEIAKAQAEIQDVLNRLSAARSRSRSLEKLTLMCTYLLRDLEIQHLRATHAPADEIRAKATALHGWVSDHATDGVFLINAQRLSLNRMLTRYGVGEPRRRPAPATAPAAAQ